MRRIAYIPARGGSKGIPKKNIKALCGKPLIAYTIEAALETGLFDVVFVSTDSAEIAGVAKQYGAQVPFLRYAEVAQDTTKTIDTVCSDVARMRNLGWEFDTFVLLQATSPLRRAKDIAGAVARFEGGNGGGVVSLSPVSEHPVLMRSMSATGELTRVLNCSSTVRRQDLPPFYRVNGAIYVNAWGELNPELSLNDNPIGYVIAEEDAVDIDTIADFTHAEELLKTKM